MFTRIVLSLLAGTVLFLLVLSFFTGRWFWSNGPSTRTGNPGVVVVSTQVSDSYNTGVNDSVCKALAGNADGFGESVNPSWVTFLAPNGCMIATNGGVDFTVPNGWRADFTDLDGIFHSCGASTGEGGLYGPAEGSAENAVSMWQVGSESHCLKWTAWGETHPNAFSGSSSSSSSDGGSNATYDPTSPTTTAAWKAMVVDGYGSYVSGPDEYGGIVVQLNSTLTLPKGWEAVGDSGKITAESNQRSMTPGVWTVYPPYEWRKTLGFSS